MLRNPLLVINALITCMITFSDIVALSEADLVTKLFNLKPIKCRHLQ